MRKFFYALVLVTCLSFHTGRLSAGVPLPLITMYGMLVDEFGWPYQASVDIKLTANGVQIYSKSITPAQGLAYNFLFRAPLDSGSGGPAYSQDTIAPGNLLGVKIVDSDTQVEILRTNLVVNFAPGSVLNVNLSAGTDSLNDGLSDELRQWIWYNLGLDGAFDPTKIRAQDDSDGDGVSNINEYRAGTDPANADDQLRLFIDNSAGPDLRALTFYSVPGKAYQIQSTSFGYDGITTTNVLFASSPTGAATNPQVIGTGHYLTVFVPVQDALGFYRIALSSKTGISLVP